MLPTRLVALLRALVTCSGLGLLVTASQGQIITVLGNNVAISPGDSTPSAADHTDFGAMLVSAGVVDRVFTIRNAGNATLNVLGIQRLGSAAGDFTIPVPPAMMIAPMAQTTFAIRFNPSFIGIRGATIRIQTNASNVMTFDFAIQGRGTVPEPEITILGGGIEIPDGDAVPGTADGTEFGSIDLSDPPITRNFTIRNDGNASLSITKSEMVGASSTAFSFAPPPSSTVPIGGSITFSVRFAPVTTGLHTATIRIHNNDSDEGAYDFAVRGTGTTTTPEVRLIGKGLHIPPGDTTPSAADGTKFPSIGVNDGARSQVFTIQNSGNGNLTINSIALVGGQAADFRVQTIPTAPILPDRTATFEVVFDPSAYGLRTTTLRINSNDPAYPAYNVALLGAGGKFQLVRIERAGNDIIVHFTTNPDTTVSAYIYSIRYGTSLTSMNTIKSLSNQGGTTEQYRHVGGFSGPRGFWQVVETVIP